MDEWLTGFPTGCHFMKGQKCFALPQRLNSDPAFPLARTPKTHIRSGTKLTFITCRGWTVKLFSRAFLTRWESWLYTPSHRASTRRSFEHASMASLLLFLCGRRQDSIQAEVNRESCVMIDQIVVDLHSRGQPRRRSSAKKRNHFRKLCIGEL
jgi:hypothetical protein